MHLRSCACFSLILFLGCCGGDGQREPTERRPEKRRPFTEIASVSGLDFEYFNARAGQYYLSEIVGSGLAWLDYDRDGDLDLYVVQGATLDPGSSPERASPAWAGQGPPIDRLFRNDLRVDADGTPRAHFVDVTASSGIVAAGYGMGVAAGDYDNDGWVDLYVTQVGINRLFRNNGDGSFTDETARTGVGGNPWWSVSAAFADYDGDGWLDLFVTHYLAWSHANDKKCTSVHGIEDYCSPNSYRPLPDQLFHNRGDGTFEDVTVRARIGTGIGAGLGVVAADFDNDGRLDFYVANDGHPNNLWINQGNGTFEDRGLLAGCAINGNGKAEASMGVDVADFDEDGDEDLFMTHLSTETNTLFVNGGASLFSDRSGPAGVGPPSFEFTGFGGGWIDFDNDGWLDLFAVNGAVRVLDHLVRQGDPFPFHQPNQLFRNLGGGRFEEIPSGLGDESAVSRGAALGDMDNDGDLDIAVSNNDGPVRLFRNDRETNNHWIGLRLMGPPSTPRAMLGAFVAVHTGSGRTLWRRVRRDGSYASSNDPRLVVGLGGETEPVRVVARWPGGTREQWEDLTVDGWHTLQEGTGQEMDDR